MTLGEVASFAGGVIVVVIVLSAAVRTVVVPRAESVLLNRIVFVLVKRVFDLAMLPRRSYESRDHILARYAPLTLLTLPIIWAAGTIAGFTAMQWAVGVHPFREAFVLSGSSFTTLGFERAEPLGSLVLAIVEALIGLGLVALLISFLPTMYGHFSRREATVAKLHLRAEDATRRAEPATLLIRAHMIGGLDRLDEQWDEWENWFIELEETHTSFPALVFFRSPVPERSWITAAGLALDGAALHLAVVDAPRNPKAALMIRAGFFALRRIADFFAIPYNPDPAPDDPITVTREEFDEVYERLAGGGVPVVADRDQAWRDFRGWRVNYDEVLVSLAAMLHAPDALWSSDRGARFSVRVMRRAPGRRAPGAS